MNDAERMRVLELLEQGTITATEAAELLAALESTAPDGGRRDRPRAGAPEPSADRPRWFRLRVTDTRSGRPRANITIPIAMVGFRTEVGRRLRIPGGMQVDDLMEAVRRGRRGTLLDVVSDISGDRVEIILE